MIKRLFLAAFASGTLAACATAPAEPIQLNVTQSRYEAGVVSAADPRAAEAGAEMLRKGGSATDAAIATMIALTVVEPQSSGIGGGGFYMRSDADGTLETIDGREKAPAGATPDWFLGSDGTPLGYREAVLSGLSVGVPGNIALAAEAHAKHGKLDWAELFRPAIRLAREGWELTPRGHEYLSRMSERASHDPAGKALYFGADGKPKPVGTRLANPALAETLEMIAAGGPDAFFAGDFAAGLAARAASETPRAGAMTANDVASYRATRREPVCGMYRAYKICGMAPPSSGATTVIAILGQLEQHNLAALGKERAVAWHLFAESQRLAYADRERFLADADFIAVPVVELIDPDYLARRGALISPDSTMATAEPGLNMPPPDGMEPPENGTSHFVAVDRAGNAVTWTSTIEGPFGSGLMYRGFHLNNELTDFSFVPAMDGEPVANRVEGGKRPRSSMAPTLVYDRNGRLVLAIGAAGGSTIPVQVARALIGFIDWRLPIDEALALPVVFSPGDTVMVEEGPEAEALIAALKALGHEKVIARRLPVKTNAVALTQRSLAGAADPRSEGTAISE
ncbi:MAG: gamma-glutamyltransferase [Sphingomonadaceae bacterium]